MTATMYDSGPTWLFGPRSYNGKFGGAGGGGSKLFVVDRALAVQAVFQRLREEGVIGDKWYTSYHTGHELVPEHPDLQCIRNPHAIDWAQLVALSQEGKIPLTNALTHPCFGYNGAEQGGILHPDAGARQRAFLGHVETITRSGKLAEMGIGNGRAIWWPAGDGFRPAKLPANTTVDTESIKASREWDQLHAFWVKVLRETGGTVHLESKPGDPQIDVLCTLELAIAFCLEVNEELGRTAMFLNHEFAHLLAMGIPIDEGMERTINAGLFDGFFHGNSGQMLGYSLEDVLSGPVHPLDITVIADYDLAVGEGSPVVVEDQKRAFRILRTWSESTGKPVVCEHDLHPFEHDGFEYFETSVRAAQKMWDEAV